jgi:hypothetical protein
MYGGRRETYRAGVQIVLDGARTLGDYDRATSPYHSKHMLAFDLKRGSAHCTASFWLAGEHALCATVEATGASRIAVLFEYTRLLSAGGEWGESGLVGCTVEDELTIQAFEDGDAFTLWASTPPHDTGITHDLQQAITWASTEAPGLPSDGFVTVIGRRGETVALYAVLGLDIPSDGRLMLLLARGRTLRQARHRLATGRRTSEPERERKVAEDDLFWSRAPRLEGDWPAHWRRGLVYDLETLRMMVRAPIGIYRHVWDAMQIQAPRVVLAETAIDALLLSYAEPRTAQALMLGVFLDAPEACVPCSREDGSYNMVAADGTVCGTAPAWGYPWLVLDWLDRLAHDRDWLDRIYPHLADYLNWWLANRRDQEGWLVYACSWESGQDDSPRFGDQPLGGGHPVRHVRPADLQAAFAHACAVTARFAEALGRTADVPRWQTLAEEFRGRTAALWHAEGRFADFDTRAGRLTDVDDVMLLAPVALGVAQANRVERLRPVVQRLDPDELTWPMLAWTAVAAAEQAGLPERAAELAATVVERAYSFWDARTAHPERTLPGVACEYWPPNGRCGGEGYGWGAFTTHLLLHTLVGLIPDSAGLRIRPNLPPAWRTLGRHYALSVRWRDLPLVVVIEPQAGGRVLLRVNEQQHEIVWGEEVTC